MFIKLPYCTLSSNIKQLSLVIGLAVNRTACRIANSRHTLTFFTELNDTPHFGRKIYLCLLRQAKTTRYSVLKSETRTLPKHYCQRHSTYTTRALAEHRTTPRRICLENPDRGDFQPLIGNSLSDDTSTIQFS